MEVLHSDAGVLHSDAAKALTLHELNGLIREVLERSFGDGLYWLAAELSEVRIASNGHCYVEFIEKTAHGNTPVAKARGVIWRGTYGMLSDYFFRVTGQRLTAGMKVLVCVSVTFHELYGFSLNISDIEPSYTLGDMMRRRAEILAMLEADGVLELNKSLPLPRIPWRIAVVSSETAAGYGDFCDQLAGSGYAFRLQLFAAAMQGERIEQSVIAALDAVMATADEWDAVVIIRGGGAVSDLSGFDSYLLASHVAQFPLPVLTGIGHERDDTVIDAVAHTRLKTPTAVAAFLIDARRREEETLKRLAESLMRAARQSVENRRRHFETVAMRFGAAASRFGALRNEKLLRLYARLSVGAQHLLAANGYRLESLSPRLTSAIVLRFDHEHHRLAGVERSLRLAAPERILALGYSITMRNGKPVTAAAELRAGDCIVTRLADGEVHSTVITENTKKNGR